MRFGPRSAPYIVSACSHSSRSYRVEQLGTLAPPVLPSELTIHLDTASWNARGTPSPRMSGCSFALLTTLSVGTYIWGDVPDGLREEKWKSFALGKKRTPSLRLVAGPLRNSALPGADRTGEGCAYVGERCLDDG
jgi:hypothetical protein